MTGMQAKQAYVSKEKESTIGQVVYETAALPKTTPCDLSGRKMVAPPTEVGGGARLRA